MKNQKIWKRKMKGQFFLLTASFLIIILYLGISVYLTPSFSAGAGSDLSDFFSNIRDEYPRAFNFGLEAANPATTLADFSRIALNATNERKANLHALWIMTQNDSDDLNVTVGNSFGQELNVTLNVSGDAKVLRVAEGGVNSTLFSSPPSEFQLRASFNTTEKNVLLEKYKASLYVILEITKGSNRIAGETKA
jgi:ABC-type Na+ efflux pump permease subunit